MSLFRLKPLHLLLACAGSAHAATDGATAQHTVKPGDTLISICHQPATGPCDWREVQRINSVSNPLRLVPGQVLRLAAPRPPPPPEPPDQALLVELVHSHGEVTLERPGVAATRLVGGESLRAGDTVRTGAQSSASMRLPDGSRLVLHAHSAVLLERHAKRGADAGQDTQVNLQRGSLDTHVLPVAAGQPVPRFQIRTRVANLGVRGTEFRIRVADSGAILEVLQGRVEASVAAPAPDAATPPANNTNTNASPAAVQVSAGTGVVAKPEGLGPVRPLPAAPNLTAVPVLVQHLPLLLDFTGTAPATRWRARVSAPGAPEQPLLEGEFNTPMARWANELPDGTYELRVRAADESGLESPDALTTFVLKARPFAPLLVDTQPAAAGVYATGLTSSSAAASPAFPRAYLAWHMQPDAASYQAQLAQDIAFTQLRAQTRILGATAAEVAAPPGRYFWRVASVRADGTAGPWSESRAVEVLPLPPQPTPAPPPMPAAPKPWWMLGLPLLLWLL